MLDLKSILLLIALILPTGAVFAQDTPPAGVPASQKAAEQQENRRQKLAEDKAAIERLRQEVSAFGAALPGRSNALQAGQATERMVEQARLDSRSLELRQEDLTTSITHAQRQIQTLEETARELEAQEQLLKNPVNDATESARRSEQLEQVRQSLAQQRMELEIEKQNLTNLQERLELTIQRLALARQWQSRSEEVYRAQQEQNRREAHQDLAERLEKERQIQLDKASELRVQLEQGRESLSEAQRLVLESRIQSAEETAKLLTLDIRLSGLDGELARWQSLAAKSDAEPHLFQEGLEQLGGLRAELQDAVSLLQRKVELFLQHQAVIQRRETARADTRAAAEEAEVVGNLVKELNTRLTRIEGQFSRAGDIQARLDEAHKDRLSRALLARTPLPNTAGEWRALGADLKASPGILFYQLRLSAESALEALRQADFSRWLQWAALEFGLLGLMVLARGYLARSLERNPIAQEEGGSLGRVTLMVLQLLRNNLWSIALIASLGLALWVFRVPQPGLAILMTLALLWAGIKMPIDLAWLLLAGPPPGEQPPRLYRQVFWTLLVGGSLMGIVILSHLSGLPQAAVRVFERSFMVYWLLVLLPLLRIRRALLLRLVEHYGERLWFKGLRVVSLLLPLTLAVAALLGLAGYLNLAWTVIWQTLVFAGVLAVWLTVRGLLGDLMVLLKNYAIAHSSYSLLWTQEIITPLHRTLRVLLLFGAWIGLLEILNWQGGYAVLVAIRWQEVLLTVALVLLVYEFIVILASYAVERSGSAFGGALIRHTRQPIGLILPIAALQILVPALDLSEPSVAPLRQLLALGQIATVAWLIVSLVSVIEELIGQRYLLEAKDKLGARRVRTQLQMVRRIVLIAIYVIAISAMLMTFPRIRQFGTGLLASAGVAGLVIGVAARPFLENLIAGIQIGLTQPIRIDDAILVEGEWGRVAEINATHVVVHLWDDRRLIVPLNYFNTQPFQNWTRTGSELLGTALFHVDYSFPVEEGRHELKRILDGTPLWDGRAWALQVTNANERTIELRALMSATDAPTAWDLRCYVREKFIEFIQQNHPDRLPKTRIGMAIEPSSAQAASGLQTDRLKRG